MNMEFNAPEPKWQHFAPVDGWAAFNGSPALTEALWQHFPASAWHYLNLTAGRSVWESRQDASMVVIHYEGEDVVELLVQAGAAAESVRSVVADFRLVPVGEAES